MRKSGIPKEELLKILDETIPEPLRHYYYDVTNYYFDSAVKPAIRVYEEKGTLRTVAEGIVRALKAPIERFLRWWRRVRGV